jgi:hypothetical protein
MNTPPVSSVQRYLKLDPEAAQILDCVAPSPNKRGAFLSRLIFDYWARKQERERIAAALLLQDEVDPGGRHQAVCQEHRDAHYT